MDARITKSRLANLLSYDWLKIVIAVAVSIVGLALVFSLVSTRPTNAQYFTVYVREDLSVGKDFSSMADTLKEKDVFSYDTLDVRVESFSGNEYAGAAFSARRAAGEGTVMLLSDNRIYETDDEGNFVTDEETGEPIVQTESELYAYAFGSAVTDPEAVAGGAIDTEAYLVWCEQYLAGFYEDGDWENGAIDEAAVRQSFLARNGSDKRYKTAAKREQGVADERARIEKLREDYLFVCRQFLPVEEGGTGLLKHTVYEETAEDGSVRRVACGVALGGLERIKDFVYYTDADGTATAESVNLVLLYNNYTNHGNDLRFEAISLMRYLVETYGEAQ